jgi:hypothetical protein
MSIAGISTILSSIKTAIDIAKAIKESDVSLEKAEFKLKLAELISALADAKIQVTEVQQALSEKDAEILVLNEKLSIKKRLKWEQPYYWLVEDGEKDGPFCQNCYDKKKELIRLQGNGEGYWECKACKNSYRDSKFKTTLGIISASRRGGIDWSGY